jgi:hypoxanthine phosphoribosyltransferase
VTGAGQGATGTPRPHDDEVVEPTGNEPQEPSRAVDATRFAHASEAEMARILDFYAVRWEYEPSTFPILWNLDGEVVESFAPDFYLPELEVFLEMTTLKQRLVRKKNRKLRRLRELYPDIRIKLFYARDFRAMMLKYGRLGLAESLSGTPGQVVPERAAVEVPSDEPELVADDAVEPLPVVLVQEAVDRGPTGRRPAAARKRPGRRRRSQPVDTSTGAEQEAEA